MLIIQCRESMFTKIIQVMHPYEPEIVEESGGYINLFDKDWIFVKINPMHEDGYAAVCRMIALPNEQFIFGFDTQPYPRVIQQGITVNEQYIVIRYDSDSEKHSLLYGFGTHIQFVSPIIKAKEKTNGQK